MKKTIFLTVFIAVAIVTISCSGGKSDGKVKATEQEAKTNSEILTKENSQKTMTTEELTKTLAAYNIESINFIAGIFTDDFQLTDEVIQKVNVEHKRIFDKATPLIKQAQKLSKEENDKVRLEVMMQLLSVPNYESVYAKIDTMFNEFGETDEYKDFFANISSLINIAAYINPDDAKILDEDLQK